MSRQVMSEIDSILEQRLKGLVENGIESVLEIAHNISECCREDDNLKKSARTLMSEFIEMEGSIQQQLTALRHIKEMTRENQDSENLIGCLDNRLAELEAMNISDPRNHPKYQEMETKMVADEKLISDMEFDTLRATLLGSTEDEDIALTQTEVNTKCPFSQQMMVDPVRNKVCGHTYDRDPILEHIKARKGRAKCPVGGCTNTTPLNAKMLVPHSDLKKYINYLNKGKASSSR